MWLESLKKMKKISGKTSKQISEETGISKEVLHHSDEKIRLPIEGKTQSLNVSVACGAILYEAVRQKL